MSKRFVIIMLACTLVFVGIFLSVKQKPTSAPNGEKKAAVQATEHKTGAGNKGVTLTEYGDFACPACYQYYPLVEAVKEKYKDDITFQFRHYPLIEIHKNALVAAKAAEAAHVQGKFWEMYSLLYQNQPAWKDSNTPLKFFEDYATQLGLNLDKFREDSKSEAVNAIVLADRAEAQKQGFSGTPSFMINDKKVESPRDVEGFSKLIDEAMKKQQKPDIAGFADCFDQ